MNTHIHQRLGEGEMNQSPSIADLISDAVLVSGPPPDTSGKFIGLYFAAHWSAPCVKFNDVLLNTCLKLDSKTQPFQVIVVPLDKSLHEFKSYFNQANKPIR